MKVKIIGYADRKGTSKAGKDYHFTVIHYLSKSRFVVGHVGVEKPIDPDVCPAAALKVDQVYDLAFDQNGQVVSIRDHAGKLLGVDNSDPEDF